MTKKDFELIASILKYRIITLDNNTNIKILVNDFAKNLEDLYSRFNKEKFLQACGIITEIKRKKCNDPCCINNNRTMEGLCDNCK